MLDHKSCRAESDYTADVCRRQPFLVDRKGKMKWTRSPGSAVIPFSLSFTPPPPPFSFLCHAGRSVSSPRNELFMTWRLNGKVKEDLRQARMRQASLSLCALHFSRSSPLQTPGVPFRLIRSTIYNPHYYPNPGSSKLPTSPCGSFDSPWSGWSCFISPDLDHSNGTHQKITR